MYKILHLDSEIIKLRTKLKLVQQVTFSISLEEQMMTSNLTHTFPGDARGRKLACQCRRCARQWITSLVWEDSPGRTMVIHSFSCLDIRMDRSVVDSIPWGHTESDMTEATQYACVRAHTHTHTHTYTHSHFLCLNIHILNHCFFVCLFYSDSLYFITSQIFLFFLLSFHTFTGIDIAVLGGISQATYVSVSEHDIFGALRSKING